MFSIYIFISKNVLYVCMCGFVFCVCPCVIVSQVYLLCSCSCIELFLNMLSLEPRLYFVFIVCVKNYELISGLVYDKRSKATNLRSICAAHINAYLCGRLRCNRTAMSLQNQNQKQFHVCRWCFCVSLVWMSVDFL